MFLCCSSRWGLGKQASNRQGFPPGAAVTISTSPKTPMKASLSPEPTFFLGQTRATALQMTLERERNPKVRLPSVTLRQTRAHIGKARAHPWKGDKLRKSRGA